MKARKELRHDQLIHQVIKQLSVHFLPTSRFLEERISDLIEREYLARDKKDPTVYLYIWLINKLKPIFFTKLVIEFWATMLFLLFFLFFVFCLFIWKTCKTLKLSMQIWNSKSFFIFIFLAPPFLLLILCDYFDNPTPFFVTKIFQNFRHL